MGDHDVQSGDQIFLHDFDRGTITGPFVATTDGLQTVEPDAWADHSRDFPNQVRITATGDVYEIDTIDFSGSDRISNDDIFYDLSDEVAAALVEELQSEGRGIEFDPGESRASSIEDDRSETDVADAVAEIVDRIESQQIWQIIPEGGVEYWLSWEEESIASLGFTLDTSESESRADRVEAVSAFDEAEHDSADYQAYLFQEVLEQDDILIATQPAAGDIEVYGIGRVISPYLPDHPTKLGYNQGPHEHQVGVSWYALDESVTIDVDEQELSEQAIAPIDLDVFSAILRELAWTDDFDLDALTSHLGVSETGGTDQDPTGVEIPASHDAVSLDELVFRDSETLVERILAALRTGKHVILTGPPGTGKSALANVIASACTSDQFTTTTATTDWTTFDTIGGYRPDSNGDLTFQPGLFLDAFEGVDSPSQWLIVDEINRCDIDKAFGSLFTALSGDTVTLPFVDGESRIVVDGDLSATDRSPAKHRYVIPEDWRMIGTMNTFDKMSLYDLSYAFMRRFAFVTVPAPRPSDIDIGLIHRYVEGWQEIHDGSEYYRGIANVWTAVNEAESCKIGPAIVRDVLQFVMATDGDFDGAVASFVFPQLERLQTRHQVATLESLFELKAPALDEAELRELGSEHLDLSSSDFKRFGSD